MSVSDKEQDIIAFYAIGVASESRTKAYELSVAGDVPRTPEIEYAGNSGYSFGTIQVDIGQHPEVAGTLTRGFQAWAHKNHPDWVLTPQQESQVIHDLKRHGAQFDADNGRDIAPGIKDHVNAFLSSPEGKNWVHAHDVAEIGRIKENIFTPLERTKAFKGMSDDDQVKMMAAMGKLYNQSQKFGLHALEMVESGKINSVDQLSTHVDGILKRKGDYLESGKRDALYGADTVIALRDMSKDNHYAEAWESMKSDPLKQPGGLSGEAKANYELIRNLFNDPSNAPRRIQRAEPHQEKHASLESTQENSAPGVVSALGAQDRAIYERIRSGAPQNVRDDAVLQATADLKQAGLTNAQSIDKIALHNGALFITSDHTAGYAHSKTMVEGQQQDPTQAAQQIEQVNQQQQQQNLAFQQQQQAQSMTMSIP